MTRAPGPPDAAATATGVYVLVAAAASAIAATVAYWIGADTQVFGGLAALSLLLAGIGLVWWARTAMPDVEETDARHELASSPAERAELAATFTRGSESISRRRLLVGSLAAVAGTYAVLGLSMLRSLAPNPEPILRHTAWQRGSRLVTAAGEPLKADEIREGEVITVFPEAHVGDADAQTLVIKVRPSQLDLPAGQESWAQDGTVAYSKVCTHAGCPVGLYQEQEHLLLCPCHQSTFDVRRGAMPTSGPAARALPQLPLGVDADGYLVAEGDYQTPIGPGFWNMKDRG